MLSTWSYLVVLLLFGISQQAGFSSPDYVTPYGSGRYENVVVWYVGQTEKVIYDISNTGLEDYTIALWQQSVSGAGATQGSIVYSVALPQVSDSFEWVVALDGFDLDVSPLFFFWIFNGSSSNQGNTAYTSVSSAYFNISSGDPPTSSVSTSTTTSASSTPSSTTISSASTNVPTQTSTPTPSSSASGSATAVSKSNPSESPSSNNGISTGAGVGIGVGVGLAGICAVICAAIIVRGRRQKAKEEVHELPPYRFVDDKSPQLQAETYSHTSPPGPGVVNLAHPVEIYSSANVPVELFAGPR